MNKKANSIAQELGSLLDRRKSSHPNGMRVLEEIKKIEEKDVNSEQEFRKIKVELAALEKEKKKRGHIYSHERKD